MAINVRKGSAHSLTQTDFVGSLKSGEGVDAGHLVMKNSDGEIVKAPTNWSANDGLIGFAITSQAEGDAIESNKIGVYALDGGSVIETSYFAGSVTSANVGDYVIPDTVTAGYVKVVSSRTDAAAINLIIGKVYDAPRTIYVGQSSVTVLPIKLAAN
jgi:hypothetical protein